MKTVKKLLKRLKERRPVKLKPFKKDKLAAILRDFEETGLYEDNFLQDLEEGLNRQIFNIPIGYHAPYC